MHRRTCELIPECAGFGRLDATSLAGQLRIARGTESHRLSKAHLRAAAVADAAPAEQQRDRREFLESVCELRDLGRRGLCQRWRRAADESLLCEFFHQKPVRRTRNDHLPHLLLQCERAEGS